MLHNYFCGQRTVDDPHLQGKNLTTGEGNDCLLRLKKMGILSSCQGIVVGAAFPKTHGVADSLALTIKEQSVYLKFS